MVAALPDGAFAVAWQGVGADDGNARVYSRVFYGDGGAGEPTINFAAGDGSDALYGADGYGADGADSLSGGGGDDILSGGAGDDTLEGGTGVDTVIYDGNAERYQVVRDGDTLTITDVSGADGTDTVTGVETLQFSDITISTNGTGRPAVLVFDTFEATEDGSLSLTAAQLLANDWDLDGNPLTIAAVGNPTGGSVSYDSTLGNITFTPTPDFWGTASFDYSVIDDEGITVTQTVTVNVAPVNDAGPVVSGPAAITVPEDTVLTLTTDDLLAATTDVDGDPLTVTDLVADGGTLTDNGYGTWTLTTASEFSGTINLTYNVSDGVAPPVPATATVEFTVVNDAPEAEDGVVISPADTTVSWTLSAIDIDNAADDLVYSLETGPANGSVTVNADGSYEFTPNAGFVGQDSFDFRVTDPGGESNVGTITVDVQEGLPETNQVPEFEIPTVHQVPFSALEPVIATIGSDKFVTARKVRLEGTSNAEISLRVYDKNGQSISGEMTVGPSDIGGSNATIASLVGGGAVVFWLSGGVGIKGRLLDASGIPVGNEISFGDSDGAFVFNPEVAALADGGFVLVWKRNQGGIAVGQRYDSSGAAVGPIFEIDPVTSGSFDRIHVAGLAGGGFVTVWNDQSGSLGDPNGIHARRYDAAGTTIGGVFLVNTHTADDQDNPSVGALNDGGFVVVWKSLGQESGGTDGIYAQRYDQNGQTVGSEFHVNSPNADWKGHAKVVGLDDGGFVIGWTTSSGGVHDILAQRYAADGSTVGIEYTLNNSSAFNAELAALPNGEFAAVWRDNDQLVRGTVVSTLPVINGSIANDVVYGLDDPTRLYGLDGDDYLAGQSGDDFLNGAAGDDRLSGGAGDDVLVGGDGTDVAVYAGNYADYLVSGGSVSATVTDQNTLDGNDGSDSLSGVEELQFADRSVFIDGRNNAPIAVADSATTQEETAIDITVAELLANDTDIEGDTLSVTGVGNATGGVVAWDDQTGVVTFTPELDFAGEASFEYTVEDGQGNLSTGIANVTVTNVNDAPVANADTATTNEYTALTFDILANDTDPDAADILTVTSATIQGGAGGTVTVNPDNTLTFDPGADFGAMAFGESQHVVIEYTLEDGTGVTATGTATVTVTGASDAPLTVVDTAATLENTAVDIDVLANDTDPDRASFTVTGATVQGGAGGPVTVNADNTLTFDPGSDFDYLAEGATTDVTIEYTVDDGEGGIAIGTATVTLTGANDAPTVSFDTATTDEDTGHTFDVLGNDSDVDGGTLSVTNAAVQGGAGGSVVVNPDISLTFDPGAAYQYLAAGETVDVTIEYTASDGQGGTSVGTATVTVTGTDDAPVMADQTVGPVAENLPAGTVVGTVVASDPDLSDSLVFEITGGNEAGLFTIDPATGVITTTTPLDYEAVATHQLTVDVETLADPVLLPPAPIGSEFPVNTHTAEYQQASVVASLSGGGFVVAWASGGVQDGSQEGVFGQRYDSNGTTLGNEFQINSHSAGAQIAPTITSLADGGFIVAWTSDNQDGDAHGVFAQRYDSSGNPVGDEFQVNSYTTSYQGGAAISSIGDGGFVVTWTSAGQDDGTWGVFGQRFNAGGSPVGIEFQVNTYTPGSQDISSVTSLAEGGFIVVWRSHLQDGDGGGIYGQRFDAVGNTVGSEFRVNTQTANTQSDPKVTSLADGGFLVTWGSNAVDGSTFDVKGQRYDGTGTPIGGEFQINSHSADSQFRPSTTALADGGFVITWESYHQDGDGNGVYGQRFDAAGSRVGDEFLVNTYTTSNQYYSGVAALSEGGFVVTWNSWGQDGDGPGVFGQVFSAPVVPPPSATAAITIDVTDGNELPVTVVDLASTDEDASVTFDVLSNDFDPGGGVLSVTDAAIQGGAGGTVVVNPDNTLTFDPVIAYQYLAEGETTDVNIEYTVSDGEGGTSTGTATLTINGTDDAPVISDHSLGAVAENLPAGTLVGTVVASDPDASDNLVFEITGGNEAGLFAIDAATGVITTTTALDYETAVNHQLTVGMMVPELVPPIPIGTEFQVNSHTASNQSNSSITSLVGGGFVVTWTSQSQDGDDLGVFGQRFDGAGNPVGDEFQVNTHWSSGQQEPSVCATSDGGFVVAWTSYGQDGDSHGIFGRRYDNSGAPLGSVDDFFMN